MDWSGSSLGVLICKTRVFVIVLLFHRSSSCCEPVFTGTDCVLAASVNPLLVSLREDSSCSISRRAWDCCRSSWCDRAVNTIDNIGFLKKWTTQSQWKQDLYPWSKMKHDDKGLTWMTNKFTQSGAKPISKILVVFTTDYLGINTKGDIIPLQTLQRVLL